MPSRARKRVVIYARLSVSLEESVSIARQVEQCRKYADSQDWDVVGVFTDDGVSASHVKPEARAGWKALASSTQPFDIVLIWKLDRLIRRILDFLHVDESLQERKAAVVSATEPINMVDPQSRAFTLMLAVFAELEASNTSARVSAARDYLIRHGRVVGGTVTYGYRSEKSPDGVGFYLKKDPTTSEYVDGMVRRALDGESVYSIQKWLDSVNAPLPKASQGGRKTTVWQYSTVERLLRSPLLAGMVAHNPKNATKVRGDEVLRDETGMPVVDKSLAYMTTDQRRKLLALLDDKTNPQRMPRAARGTTPGLLSGLANCGHCDRVMHRGTNLKRPVLTCPACHQTVGINQLTELIGKRLLEERGNHFALEAFAEDDSIDRADLSEVEAEIAEVGKRFTQPGADYEALTERMSSLQELKAKTQAQTAEPIMRQKIEFVHHDWSAAKTDTEKRAVLMTQIQALTIVKGGVGRYLDPARVQIQWTDDTKFRKLPERESRGLRADLVAKFKAGQL